MTDPDPAEIRLECGLTAVGIPPDRHLTRRSPPRVSWTALALLLLAFVPPPALGGSVNDCHGVSYAYRERGIDTGCWTTSSRADGASCSARRRSGRAWTCLAIRCAAF